MNKKRVKIKYTIYFAIIIFTFVFVILYNGFFLKLKIEEENYVPTIVNGITASTSLVLGFSGLIIGLLLREVFSKDENARSFLISIAFFFAIPIIYLFSVYFWLVLGDFNSALKTAFAGLVVASFAFIVILLFTGYRIELYEKKKKQQTSLDSFSPKINKRKE